MIEGGENEIHNASNNSLDLEIVSNGTSIPADISSVADDSITNKNERPDHRKALREFLADGFKTLKETRNKKGRRIQKETNISNLPPQSYATVNFIDPTTASNVTSDLNDSQSSKWYMSPLGGKGIGDETYLNLNLYEKLTTIFQRDYRSTLHSVPFEHLRTGSAGKIDSLQIKTILTQSHGSSHHGSGDVPWGGTSGTVAAVSDPSEWHIGPYCHVYIAACETVDQYRSKVRPALQAFVSQIEGAAASSSIGRGNQQNRAAQSSNNYSAHYIVVYVPIRNRKGPNSNSEKETKEGMMVNSKSIGGVFATKLSQARKLAAGKEISGNSFHSIGSYDTEPDDLSAVPPPGPIAHSSKTEKEIYKKFTSDFPNGKICILSTLMDSVDDSSVASTSPLKNQEWNSFLRMLGAAVVNGFRDRCHRYDSELRRLDATRANGNRVMKGLAGKNNENKPVFDLGHFFLVKESLAFTFEQMQLPAEALMQYEELRAFLPQTSGEDHSFRETEDERKKRIKKATKRQSVDFDEGATTLAIVGDTIAFRKRLRSVTDIGIVEQTILQYLYTRESTLLFQMKAPVEILQRSNNFVQIMYKMKVNGIGVIQSKKLVDEEKTRRRNEAERWALNFCWDVKCATDNYFTVLRINQERKVTEFSFDKLDQEDGYEDDDRAEAIPLDPKIETIERRMASKIGELLEFARLRFLCLGDAHGAFENPIRVYSTTLPSDLMKEWKPWTADVDIAAIKEKEPLSPSRGIMIEKGGDRINLLDGVFETELAYESRYLQIAGAVARCNRLAGRRRLSSRFQTQIAEIYMKRGDYRAAAKSLLPIVDVCATDGWDRCHFWHLFRLACCQRRNGKIPAYLNTLTLCFGSHLEGMAPRAAAEALQRDFEAVLSHPQVSQLRLGISSFLETDLTVEPTSGGRSSMLLNFVRKKLVKSFCKVGEPVRVKLTVRSYLPNPIPSAEISLLLVSFAKYEELFHNRELVSMDDAFAIIRLENTPTIEPGDNIYEFKWTPVSTGIFTLSTVQMKWNHGCFHYDSAVLRKPLSAIEVLPSDPTQSLELNPLFLIPGHVQDVRLTFNAGSDIVEEGKVVLVCSDGLLVTPPGVDQSDSNWVESCSVDLPQCNEDGIIVLRTSVKSRLIKPPDQNFGLSAGDRNNSDNTVQAMQARVTTSYRHKGYGEATFQTSNEVSCMTTTLEATVTTLDKPAFTVDECRTYSYSEDNLLITTLLHCNTPVPFSIKEWEIELPGLEVVDGGDMNQSLFAHPIAEGEQLSLAFNCSYSGEKEKEEKGEPVLKIVLQDEFGKTFNQVLPLDLYFFYDQMRKDKESAGASSVDAELTCSDSEGLVGVPVTFYLEIDTINVSKRNDESDSIVLLYKFISNDTDWIIGGQVKGLLDCTTKKKHRLEFTGIPTCPGIVKLFPTLSIQYESSKMDSTPLTVHLKHPDSFRTLSFVNHMALAYPVELET